MGWFEVVRGHQRSLKIAPFDRAHMSISSPSTLGPYGSTENAGPENAAFLRYGDKLVENHHCDLPHLYLVPPWG